MALQFQRELPDQLLERLYQFNLEGAEAVKHKPDGFTPEHVETMYSHFLENAGEAAFIRSNRRDAYWLELSYDASLNAGESSNDYEFSTCCFFNAASSAERLVELSPEPKIWLQRARQCYNSFLASTQLNGHHPMIILAKKRLRNLRAAVRR